MRAKSHPLSIFY